MVSWLAALVVDNQQEGCNKRPSQTEKSSKPSVRKGKIIHFFPHQKVLEFFLEVFESFKFGLNEILDLLMIK